jgi:hypothetical protein
VAFLMTFTKRGLNLAGWAARCPRPMEGLAWVSAKQHS